MIEDALLKPLKVYLISEYLKRHPELGSIDALYSTEAGQIMLNRIQEMFGELKKLVLRENPESTLNTTSHEDLFVNEEARLENCINSVSSCLRIIQQLFESPTVPFDIKERSINEQYMKSRERQATEAVRSIILTKKELLELFEDSAPKYSVERTLITEFFQQTMELIKYQYSIYKKEVELGNQYLEFVESLIKNNFSKLKEQVTQRTIKTITFAYATLTHEKKLVPHAAGTLNLAMMQDAVKKFEGRLEKRREEFELLQEVASYIENFIVMLKESSASEAKAPPQPEKEVVPAAASGRRMSFANKLMTRFRGR